MSIYVFTSISLNYIAKARVLGETLKALHPEIQLHALIAEPIPETLRGALPEYDKVLSVMDFGIAAPPSWIFKHSLVELCTAQKGFYLECLLQQEDCEAVLFFDPDIVILSSLFELIAEFKNSAVLLTPHMLDEERDPMAIRDNELHMLRYGIFNLGFLGVRNCPQGRKFAVWWRERLENYCHDDPDKGLFVDQRWVDLAPGLFPGVAILRDPGFNVATWNIHHRPIEGDLESGFRVKSRPLVFFHFSGFDSGAQKMMLERYAPHMKAAFELREWYIARLRELKQRTYGRLNWFFDSYSNGQPIERRHRLEYRTHQVLEEHYPNPFYVKEDSDCYYSWCQRNLSPQKPVPRALTVEKQKLEKSVVKPGAAFSSGSLLEYVSVPARYRPSPHPLFDEEFYLKKNPDVANSGLSAFEHYLRYGAREGRNPHPLFDAPYYLSQVSHRPEARENPLKDFLEFGQQEGLRPTQHKEWESFSKSLLRAIG